MGPPSYLLDKTFLVALADVSDTNHDEAKLIYRSLIDDFVAQRCLLVARSDHLDEVANPELFAAVDKLHPARQHRNAAKKMVEASGIEMDLAVTLVLIKRHKIRKVATFDDRLARYDVERIEPAAEQLSESETVEN